jgi:hypothetical protein
LTIKASNGTSPIAHFQNDSVGIGVDPANDPQIVFGANGNITAAGNGLFSYSRTWQNDDNPGIRFDSYQNYASLAVKNPSSYNSAAFQVLSDGYGTSNVKIELNNDGSITAAGDIKANTVTTGDADVSSTTAEGAVMRVNGIVDAQRKAGSTSAAVRVWQGDQRTIEMFATGDITTEGDIFLGDPAQGSAGTGMVLNADAGKINLYSDNGTGGMGNYFLAGYSGAAPKPLAFSIDYAGDATFNGTVTANGTVLTRAGGTTLDVGDRLEKVDAALQNLKTVAAAASDFAALKSAIATALADV